MTDNRLDVLCKQLNDEPITKLTPYLRGVREAINALDFYIRFNDPEGLQDLEDDVQRKLGMIK